MDNANTFLVDHAGTEKHCKSFFSSCVFWCQFSSLSQTNWLFWFKVNLVYNLWKFWQIKEISKYLWYSEIWYIDFRVQFKEEQPRVGSLIDSRKSEVVHLSKSWLCFFTILRYFLVKNFVSSQKWRCLALKKCLK